VLREPEAPWQVHLTSIKPWPSCRHTHPAIDAALALAGKADPATIERVEVMTYGAAIDVCNRPAANSEYEAKFSLQHCVAAALQRGRIDFAAFGPEARAEAAPLAARVRVAKARRYDDAYPGAWGAGVAIETAGGARIEAARPECKGDPEAALGVEERVAKARGLLRYGGINDADGVIGRVLGLADGGAVPDIALLALAAV
jgi:2-methylcitrate dehydratase PrpD